MFTLQGLTDHSTINSTDGSSFTLRWFCTKTNLNDGERSFFINGRYAFTLWFMFGNEFSFYYINGNANYSHFLTKKLTNKSLTPSYKKFWKESNWTWTRFPNKFCQRNSSNYCHQWSPSSP